MFLGQRQLPRCPRIRMCGEATVDMTKEIRMPNHSYVSLHDRLDELTVELLRDPLRELTRSLQQRLLFASAVLVLLSLSVVTVVKLEAGPIELSVNHPISFVVVGAAIVLYLLSAFGLAAYQDRKCFDHVTRPAIRRLSALLDHEAARETGLKAKFAGLVETAQVLVDSENVTSQEAKAWITQVDAVLRAEGPWVEETSGSFLQPFLIECLQRFDRSLAEAETEPGWALSRAISTFTMFTSLTAKAQRDKARALLRHMTFQRPFQGLYWAIEIAWP